MSYGTDKEVTEGIPNTALTDALATAVDATIMLAPDGTVETVSGSVPATLGYSASELTGQSVTALFAATASSSRVYHCTTPEEFEAALLGEEAAPVTAPLDAADGTVVPVSVRTLENPETAGQICLVRDLTDLRGETANSALLDTLPDPLYVLDSDGKVEQVNTAFVNYTGYRRDELRGRELTELMTLNTDGQQTLISARDPETDSQRTTFETTLVTKDGEQILTEAHVASLTEQADSAGGAIGVLRDIRERKRRAQNLNLLKQVLTRVFRHNIRNELLVAKGHTELLEDSIDEGLQKHTSEIMETADRLLAHSEKARLVEEVIGTEELHELDITDVVAEVVDTAIEAYPDANIDVELPAEAVVEANPQIGKAIEELLENAIEHAPETEPARVNIWLDQREGQTLFVEDESGGIADHEKEVLERGGEHDLEHSNGVGLWLIRWLVEYSEAELIIHRTDDGTLMGIRFDPEVASRGTDATAVGESPLTRAPAHVQELSPERFRGDTVIGRIDALGELEDAYDRLEHSGGHSILVTGEAGIGKTTLVEQFCEKLEGRSPEPVIATGACNSEEQQVYGAFREPIEALPTKRDLSGILADTESLSASNPEELQERKKEIFGEIADELRTVAAEQPVVLIVEDMHWADQGTIDLFKHLVETVGQWSYPVLFLGTYRTSDVELSHPVLEIAEDTAEAGRGTVVEMEPFGEAEVRSLLSYMLDFEPLPESFTDAVAAHTGGAPLFVNELGRHLVETLGPVQSKADLPDSLAEIDIPATVESAIAERLNALPAGVDPVLGLGAVIGREFSFDLLRTASNEPTETLIDCSKTLDRRDIWERSGTSITFVHDLIREEILKRVTDEERARFHANVADAIETLHSDALDEHAGRLGYHYEQIGEYATAYEHYRQAGKHAADTYANDDAIEYYERALRIADEQEAVDRATRAATARDLADIFLRRGAYDRAKEYYQKSLAICEDIRDREGTGLSLTSLGAVHLYRDSYDKAIEYYEKGLDIRREVGDRKGEATVLNSLGVICSKRSSYDRAEAYYEESLDIQEEIGDRRGMADTLNNLGVNASKRGAYDRAREYFEDCIALMREIGYLEGQKATLIGFGQITKAQGDYEEARGHYEEALAICEEVGDREEKGGVLNGLGGIATVRGSYDQAEEYCEESLDIRRDIGDRSGEASALESLGNVALKRGAYRRAEEHYEESRAIREEIGARRGEASSLRHLGQTANSRGNPERAESLLTDALDIARDIEAADLDLSILRALGVVSRRQGAHDEAEQYLEDALDLSISESPRERAKTHLERARLALDRADNETAYDALEQAHDGFAEIDAAHDKARVTLLRGRLANRRGAPDEGREHWRDALETFEDVGAPQDALRALRLLVQTSHERGDDERARQYRERARSVFEQAPKAVRADHAAWLDSDPD